LQRLSSAVYIQTESDPISRKTDETQTEEVQPKDLGPLRDSSPIMRAAAKKTYKTSVQLEEVLSRHSLQSTHPIPTNTSSRTRDSSDIEHAYMLPKSRKSENKMPQWSVTDSSDLTSEPLSTVVSGGQVLSGNYRYTYWALNLMNNS